MKICDMKRVFLASHLVLILLFSIIRVNAQSNIIGNPIKIGNLEVAQHNYSSNGWDDAKKIIKELSSIIEVGDVKARTRLSKLKTKLELKEAEFLKNKSNTAFVKINNEAEELGSKEYEEKNRELQEQKERIDSVRYQIEKIQLEKKTQLLNFHKQKYNWIDFKGHLEINNIKELYHFTDKANLKSIIKEQP
jgi:hypothetical protein